MVAAAGRMLQHLAVGVRNTNFQRRCTVCPISFRNPKFFVFSFLVRPHKTCMVRCPIAVQVVCGVHTKFDGLPPTWHIFSERPNKWMDHGCIAPFIITELLQCLAVWLEERWGANNAVCHTTLICMLFFFYQQHLWASRNSEEFKLNWNEPTKNFKRQRNSWRSEQKKSWVAKVLLIQPSISG